MLNTRHTYYVYNREFYRSLRAESSWISRIFGIPDVGMKGSKAGESRKFQELNGCRSCSTSSGYPRVYFTATMFVYFTLQ